MAFNKAYINMVSRTSYFLIAILFLNYGCKKNTIAPPVHTNPIDTVKDTTVVARTTGPPNVIFILVNDLGYEMPTFDGGQSYNTTHLDSLAANGMVFSQCWATPNSSPSRVELLSGLYNFRNYLHLGWGDYNPQYISYPRIMQNYGYKTCMLGDWELDNADVGLKATGFDNYCVWAETNLYTGFIYKNPDMYDESGPLTSAANAGKYSEDIISNYAMNYIDKNKDKPFFICYSTLLAHKPFQPTPLDPAFQSYNAPAPSIGDTYSDTTYVGSMVHYLDLKVAALISKLKTAGIANNTVIIFSSDNGSAPGYHFLFNGQSLQGEKGQTTELGTHVPLFVYWPGHIMPGGVDNNLVDFSDFLPTILDITNIPARPVPLDGVSFYPQLVGLSGTVRDWVYCYYDPYPIYYPFMPGITTPVSYAQDKNYKLYKTGPKAGNFYQFTVDPEENNPLSDSSLTSTEMGIKQTLQTALSQLK